MSCTWITGGATFLRAHLCRRLLRENQQVTCVARSTDGDERDVQPFYLDPRFSLLPSLPAATVINAGDRIIHLTGEGDGRAGSCSSSRAQDDALWQAREALRLARHAGIPVTIVTTETPEGHSIEELALTYLPRPGLRLHLVRPLGAYGPGMNAGPPRHNALLPWVVSALKDEPITVFGEDDDQLPLCYVSDVIEGVLRLSETKLYGQPVELRHPTTIGTRRLLLWILQATGATSAIRRVPAQEVEARVERASFFSAERLLDWRPRISLHYGLIKTIEDLRRRHQGERGRAGRYSFHSAQDAGARSLDHSALADLLR
jgi:nucleoside-diphosphate-sugar epimerase